MVGGRLCRIIWNEGHLFRLGCLAKRQEILGWIALDIELRFGELIVDQGAQNRQVAEPDMPLVGSRMHGQSAGTRHQRNPAECRNIRPWQVPAVAQHGDGIEIDGELRRHDDDSGARFVGPHL